MDKFFQNIARFAFWVNITGIILAVVVGIVKGFNSEVNRELLGFMSHALLWSIIVNQEKAIARGRRYE